VAQTFIKTPGAGTWVTCPSPALAGSIDDGEAVVAGSPLPSVAEVVALLNMQRGVEGAWHEAPQLLAALTARAAAQDKVRGCSCT
jgi:hypothetical protein